jgi:hypothetical protein
VATLGLVAALLFLERHNLARWMMVRSGERAVARHIAIPLDLTGQYAASAANMENDSGFWGEVPWKFQVFRHVPLQIDGMLCLWGAGNAAKGAVFPEEALGIPVNLKFQTLYVYHCTFYHSHRDAPVYNIVFRYEDGDSATNTVLYGRDLMDFNTPGGKALKGNFGHDTKVAWVGSSFTPDGKHPLLFSLTAVKNPRPAVKVASIDLYSCKGNSAGVVFAMTAGPAGMMK